MEDSGGLERLAFELASAALDRQERALDELRSRAGTLLAATSIATSFLGARALAERPARLTVVLALAAFTTSVLLTLYVLIPKENLIFSVRGTVLFEAEFDEPGGLAETHRRLAYWLERFRAGNQATVDRLVVAYRYATFLVLAEIVLWTGELVF